MIYILTEGGGSIGMGHISRCISISQALKKKGYSSKFIINADGPISTALSGIQYQLFDWINDDDKTTLIIKDASIVIIDSYKCPLPLYKKISKLCQKAVFIDDNIRLEYPSGIVVNGVLGAEKLNYSMRGDQQFLLGVQYAFLRSEFWNVPSRFVNIEVKSIMISCGGNDDGLSIYIVKLLTKEFPNLKISVVVKDILAKDIDKMREISNVLVNLNANEMKQLMSESDIAITAAGQTTYELSRIGTPFVALITAQNQAFSISNFFEYGIIQEAIEINNIKFDAILISRIRHLLDVDIRKKITKNMQSIIDGLGPSKLADYIIQHTTLS